MLPYSRGLILDNTNNYGIVKTETLFGFAPSAHHYVNDSYNSTGPLEWIITHGDIEERSLKDTDETESRAYKTNTKGKNKTKSKKTSAESKQARSKKKKGHNKNKKRRKSKGVKKCIFKILKKGDGGGGGGKKKNRRRSGLKKMQKKYMMPVILGLLAAKSVLIPIALKALAFLSAKGLMMAFFSTVMASVLSLKGMFDNNHGHYQNRKDDTKTQVEIIQVPSKSEDHVYYDDHYKRGDLVPVVMTPQELIHPNYISPHDKGAT